MSSKRTTTGMKHGPNVAAAALRAALSLHLYLVGVLERPAAMAPLLCRRESGGVRTGGRARR